MRLMTHSLSKVEFPAPFSRPTAAWLFAVVVVAGCGQVGKRADAPTTGYQVDPDTVPNAVPRVEPRSRYGNPRTYEVFGKTYRVLGSSRGYSERGIASWYGQKFHGRRTSSGETYDMYAMTAAHKSLPLPTYVMVTNLNNGRRVTLRVNDRGPFHGNRIIDLSYTAAVKLGMIRAGTALVEVRALDPSRPRPAVYHPPVAENVRLFVQAGAFRERDNARRMHGRIESILSEMVVVSPATVGGLEFFRVRVGPLNDPIHADRVTAALNNAGVVDTRILIE